MSTNPFPPGPRERFPGQHLLAMRRDPSAFLLKLARDYGDIVHFQIGARHIFLLNEPEAIHELLVVQHRHFIKGRGLQQAKRILGEGLLTSEGEFHLRQRRMMQPTFHRKRIAAYAGAMTDYAARTGERWEPGATVDMAEEMSRLTLAIVGKTLFDADVEGEAEAIGEALATLFDLFDTILFPFADLMDRLPLPHTRRLREARARLDATIFRLIEQRRAEGSDRGDLLSMLLLAQDEEGAGGMSDQQVRDEAMTIFLAGHETTANALTWSWYLLSQHPAEAARLHAELDRVLGGRPPTMEDLPALPYTRMLLSESMRLFPPAWLVGRIAIEPCELAGYTIPKGATVLASQWVTHHDPRFYPEPFRFDPERWRPEAQASRPRFAYFPFGGGPRLCIGESFAWMEATLLLATLAQRWQPRLVAGYRVETFPLITLRPRHGMRMVLEERSEPSLAVAGERRERA